MLCWYSHSDVTLFKSLKLNIFTFPILDANSYSYIIDKWSVNVQTG